MTGPGLGDYLQLIRRQWLAVVVCLAVGLGAAVAYLHWAPKQYDATAAVMVDPVIDPTQTAAGKADQVNMDTEAQMVTADAAVAAAAATMHVPASGLDDFIANVNVSVPANTTILDIDFTGSSPANAVKGAQAFAQAYLDQRQKNAEAQLAAEDKALQARIDSVNAQLGKVIAADAGLAANSPQRLGNDAQATALNSQLSALTASQNQVRTAVVTAGQITGQPTVPTKPSSPSKVIGLSAGLVIGLLLGFAVAALRNRSDDRIRTARDLAQRTGVPAVAVLPSRLHAGDVTILPASSPDGRSYARLRNLVTTALADAERPVVVVTGTHHAGGPVATNLAASLARSGADVVLVCADVFGSTSTALLGSPQPAGLAEVLAGETPIQEALHPVAGVPSLRVLGAGRDPDRADDLLQTASARTLVDRLLGSASYVVIDAPAAFESADAQTLAKVAEVSLLVVETGRTHAAQVVDALGQLQAMGTSVLGAVVARYGRDARPTAGQTAARGEGDGTGSWNAPRHGAHERGALDVGSPNGQSPNGHVLDDPAKGATTEDGAELLPPAPRGHVSR